MPQCDGCSAPYRYMEGKRCEPCQESTETPKMRDKWSLCSQCSRRFEFLSGNECLGCKERNLADKMAMPPPQSQSHAQVPVPLSPRYENRDIEHAMSHPVNARTHSARGAAPYSNAFQTYEKYSDENDPRMNQAKEVYEDYTNGYSNAYHASRGSHKVSAAAKSKHRGVSSSTVKVPVVYINVVIKNIVNRKKKMEVEFDPQMTCYDENKLWSEILKNIVAWLDGLYMKQFDHRIRSGNDFQLYYGHSKTILEQSVVTNPEATLADLWEKTNEQQGLHVRSTDYRQRILDLTVHVRYPIKAQSGTESSNHSDNEVDSDDDSSILYTGSGKRKADTKSQNLNSNTRPMKKMAGSRIYHTNFSQVLAKPSANQELFLVKKFTLFTKSDVDQPHLLESDKKLHVLINKHEFAAGKTKKAFKMRFTQSPGFYAAKVFFDLGYYETPSNDDNFQNLKEELLRQFSVGQAVTAFNELAIEENVSVYDLRMATSFMIQVCEGPKSESAWLVDPLLDHRKMRKFSGTTKAGENSDFAGKTCDAFAHFTLTDSSMGFVAVDIQGIDTEIIVEGIQRANAITLFDVMAHSKSRTMGLGDFGVDGIKQFCAQHKCNSVCKKLKLPQLAALMKELGDEDPSGPDGQHIGSDDEQNTLHGENRSGNGAEADTTAGISDIVA